MKHMKKLLAAVVALVMVMGMMTTAFAATITAPSDTTHTYGVYQIFTGSISNGVLTDAKWGANGTGTQEELVSGEDILALSDVLNSSASEKLEVIADYVDLESDPVAELESGEVAQNLADGYYLIKDNGTIANGDAETLYIVAVSGNTTIAPKGSAPSVTKKVKENSNSTYQDAADWNIGDDVPFRLTATLGDISVYNTYGLKFVDTISEGLSFNEDVVVKLGNVVVDEDAYSVEETDDGFTVEFIDVKAINATTGSVITVDYTAELTGDAVVMGGDGNPNEVYLMYNNNPNVSGTPGTPGTPDAPGTPGNPPTTPSDDPDEPGEPSYPGQTPVDKVVVFTYKTVVNKVDADNNALEGAGFTLYKVVAGSDDVEIETITDVTTFEFKGLDAGTYKLVETTVPTGYNKADDITFTISATYDTNSADPALTSLTVNVSGFVCNVDAGSVTGDVVNHTGTALPSTGGMGTTLFYVVGIIILVGAGVILVTRRRMAK